MTKTPTKECPDVICCKDLCYTIDDKKVLQGITVSIPKGEIFAVMGTSGCGKTTFLKLLGGLIRPTSGQINMLDYSLAKMPETKLSKIRCHFQLVFQYSALFDSLTVEQNVAFGMRRHKPMSTKEAKPIVAEKLALVGMEGSEGLYPSQLSGGMQKRVGLARALALEPEVLLYDEPTSGLDPISAGSINNLIKETAQRLGVTSVVVSHDVQGVLTTANRVMMLSEGVAKAIGSPEELMNHPDESVRAFIQAGLLIQNGGI